MRRQQVWRKMVMMICLTLSLLIMMILIASQSCRRHNAIVT
uniref:Uncharacterized protein n=1 Tax=Arundo donax TaxID=35708 RepID=A0A0A9E5Y7_ARUDO